MTIVHVYMVNIMHTYDTLLFISTFYRPILLTYNIQNLVLILPDKLAVILADKISRLSLIVHSN